MRNDEKSGDIDEMKKTRNGQKLYDNDEIETEVVKISDKDKVGLAIRYDMIMLKQNLRTQRK